MRRSLHLIACAFVTTAAASEAGCNSEPLTIGRQEATNAEGSAGAPAGGNDPAGASGSAGAGPVGVGPCAGLEGKWTLTPEVTSVSMASNVPQAYFPAVGEKLAKVGLTFFAVESTCHVEWSPSWGKSGTTTLSLADGLLVSPVLDEQEVDEEKIEKRDFGWCRWDSWLLTGLTVEPGATPKVLLSNAVALLSGDMGLAATLEASGALSSGLPEMALRGVALTDEDQDCLNEDSMEEGLTIWPWNQVMVATNQPIAPIVEHLKATLDGEPVDVAWESLTDPVNADRAAIAPVSDWLHAMGKELRIGLDSAPEAEVAFAVTRFDPETEFAGDTLESLTTVGTAERETTDGIQKLHLTGSSCGQGVYAAGVLDVGGRSRVVLELEGAWSEWYDAEDAVTALVVHADGTRQTMDLTSPLDAALSIYQAEIDGDDSYVGIQLNAQGGCHPGPSWAPDIRVIRLRSE